MIPARLAQPASSAIPAGGTGDTAFDHATAPADPTAPLSLTTLLAAHALLATAILVPFFTTDVLPLVDYAGHLARMHIIGNADDGVLSTIYAVNWAVLPNLAMDLLVPILAKLIGLFAAGKLFVLLTLALMVAGTVAVHRVVHGRASAWPLAIYPFLFNYVLSFGFINFLFGVGVYLLAFALWLRTEDWRPQTRAALFSAITVLLFFCHIFALAVYGLTVATYELWRRRPEAVRHPSRAAKSLSWAAAQFLAPCVLLLCFSPAVQTGAVVAYEVGVKLTALLVPTLVYNRPVDILLWLAAFGMLIWGLRRRSVRMSPALRPAALALVLAIIVMPTWLMDNWGNDFRLAAPLLCIAIAACDLRVTDRKFMGVFVAVVVAMVAARTVSLAVEWQRYDRMYSEFRAAARTFEPGSRILPAITDWHKVRESVPETYYRLLYHLADLSVIERPVFVPTLFTAKGRQPIRVIGPYADLDVPYERPADLATLREGADPMQAHALAVRQVVGRHFRYIIDWPNRYDYLVMFDFGAPINPLPSRLTPVEQGSYFTIYAIAKTGKATDSAPQ